MSESTQPCSNCVAAAIPCEYPRVDARKKPVSHKYLSALETRVAWFESFVRRLQSASAEERDILLQEISLDDHLNEPEAGLSASQGDATVASINLDSAISLERDSSGSLQYHGPTSIFVTEEVEKEGRTGHPSIGPLGPEIWSHRRLAAAMGIDDALINTSLSLFFLHQYPQYMFVYREAFLADYLGHTHGGKYWSFPLVCAICALGAAHSKDPNVRERTSILAKCAQEIIVTHGLASPQPTSVQALLCLAFHELGQGNSTLGWMLSGMAFRMAQGLGFHQDPSKWVISDQTITTTYDIEIRRRIYWGCYVADNNFPPDHEWFGLKEIAAKTASSDTPRKPQLTNALKYSVMLGKIFQDIMAEVFAPRKFEEGGSALIYRLGQLNLSLSRWYNGIDEPLQWSQWTSQGKELENHVVVLQ
ncbi:hypothetical protein A1O3_03704 [Capronia epimyces CBS 606.96]|uniref:Xylanolytic transcriptional activator regulatory domain-containing protein n=1 Tax=Capronia epimyces CBS 606.96 TaxID=1182542 RepID=W9YAR3_9EURO|nr:uncharacterized protein A1O3_03704 [Capronia epimyces CBS 606.96]EXJ86750.1 hypothetical protein A1O3_03704 [Capronia epimyces CBS 606.96]